jgi:hypothetical protein
MSYQIFRLNDTNGQIEETTQRVQQIYNLPHLLNVEEFNQFTQNIATINLDNNLKEKFSNTIRIMKQAMELIELEKNRRNLVLEMDRQYVSYSSRRRI